MKNEDTYKVTVRFGNAKLNLLMTRYANESVSNTLHRFHLPRYDSTIGPTIMVYLCVPAKVAMTARLLGAEVSKE